ncbi:lactonase family protein [Marinomonas sp. M1K-6]|uniref:Lactonase family protein n=1 Tax=Marinomonas profundi TaxID=2726122 RepID=A0A847QVY5_9GAMM|nr:lactonase family protein [Marinomonas profundi]NLQ17338.1 lactonase family protein [Marinomonas profundi]UDV01866.1 lactonase family protein [Marinomonas profundi]
MSQNNKARQYVYVSNAKDGTIARYLLDDNYLDDNHSKLVFLGRTPAGDNVMPLAVSPDKSHVYAAVRSESFRVISYRIDSTSGDLLAEGEASLPVSMANIDTDKSGRFLFAASYGGNLISVSPINEQGVITADAQQVIPSSRNAHAIHASPDNRFVFSTSLGDDEIRQYRFDEQNGQLTPNTPAAVKTEHYAGPRHFVFSNDGQYVYVLGELSGTVTTYAFDSTSGLLTLKGVSEGVPAKILGLENGVPPSVNADNDHPKVWAADMQLAADGRFLYLSERTTNTIVTLSIDHSTGLPSYQDITQVEQQPRGFALSKDGRFMVVSGEKDTNVGLYSVDTQSGELTKVDSAPVGIGANWVEIVAF